MQQRTYIDMWCRAPFCFAWLVGGPRQQNALMPVLCSSVGLLLGRSSHHYKSGVVLWGFLSARHCKARPRKSGKPATKQVKRSASLEFDFVRSIRVWDVRHYSHRERGRDDDCSENYNMLLGTYGTQGDFGWQRTTPAAAPQWVLPSRRCSSSNWRRGVGVEWEDHEGSHGYEWVAY